MSQNRKTELKFDLMDVDPYENFPENSHIFVKVDRLNFAENFTKKKKKKKEENAGTLNLMVQI